MGSMCVCVCVCVCVYVCVGACVRVCVGSMRVATLILDDSILIPCHDSTIAIHNTVISQLYRDNNGTVYYCNSSRHVI